jgi:hypothetical protein
MSLSLSVSSEVTVSNRSAFPDLRALNRSRRRYRLLAKRDPYRGSAATLTAVRHASPRRPGAQAPGRAIASATTHPIPVQPTCALLGTYL